MKGNDDRYRQGRNHGWVRHAYEGGREERFFSRFHGGGWGRPGGRGEGKRFFMRGEFKLALLELLESEPMHGYQLIKAMEEKTGGMYSPSPGSIYPNLQLLEDMQLVSSSEQDGKKLYRITEEGKAYLREQAAVGRAEPESRWEHRGGRRPDGRAGRYELREFIKQWPEAVRLLLDEAGAARQQPNSERAERFRRLMVKLQEDLAANSDSTPSDSIPPDSTPPQGDSSE
ncbi:PadR family transcriptional regulator [Cohnella cellulosilytica]|uniref:Helix-turn-helix transcriptional regulator n=1 Tax=Cohnella cellulosilytica TaxID=986710 RepID=A0ABW2F919_9BACL